MSSSHTKLAYVVECPISNAFTSIAGGRNSGWRRRYSHSAIYSVYHFPVPKFKNPHHMRYSNMNTRAEINIFFIIGLDSNTIIRNKINCWNFLCFCW